MMPTAAEPRRHFSDTPPGLVRRLLPRAFATVAFCSTFFALFMLVVFFWNLGHGVANWFRVMPGLVERSNEELAQRAAAARNQKEFIEQVKQFAPHAQIAGVSARPSKHGSGADSASTVRRCQPVRYRTIKLSSKSSIPNFLFLLGLLCDAASEIRFRTTCSISNHLANWPRNEPDTDMPNTRKTTSIGVLSNHVGFHLRLAQLAVFALGALRVNLLVCVVAAVAVVALGRGLG